jgi:hypothetical protein
VAVEGMEEMRTQPKVQGYFEDYRCGCVSETARYKKDLLGYCSIHGEGRRQIWPDVEFDAPNRQRGDLATGLWDTERPLPRCRGCGEIIETMWAIPAHVACEGFEIVYPEPEG